MIPDISVASGDSLVASLMLVTAGATCVFALFRGFLGRLQWVMWAIMVITMALQSMRYDILVPIDFLVEFSLVIFAVSIIGSLAIYARRELNEGQIEDLDQAR
jgi:hypothetical protein